MNEAISLLGKPWPYFLNKAKFLHVMFVFNK